MSFAFAGNLPGGSVSDIGSSLKQFYCHQCSRSITLVISPSTDPLCPHCNEGFLEEYENPNPAPTPFRPRFPPSEPFFADPFSSLLPFFLSSSSPPSTTTVDLQNPAVFSASHTSGSEPHPQNNPFDPFAFLQSHLQNLRSSGAQIQFVIENRPSDSPFPLPANLGDYFMGPGLEQLIQQLAENDPNRYGTPPASKSAMEALPTSKVTDVQLNSGMNQCAVCQDDFEKDMEVKQMPCKHIYHSDCLLPWLELHNSCPVCRHELPTDDADYETTRRARAQGSTLGSSDGGSSRAMRRTFSIMLPNPFRGGGSDGGSNSGSAGQ
ncbi:E3 ubiquitin-protein ligase RING1 [Punica granatum]|uniref:RING-type E3 ubiquitin transferase n=2 Tax=Punica granatum TaxID=22663 RepID=A0A218VT78_PUNGR|nr:E3 ubiquitin-protein ligase RING1 [Punica granatum]OWM63122.1 hypothetical protein CDL15_Pgr008038 [Punica granatum]PKI63978.1 hypothetical protein CRG98_015654 [Punica granatum]